MELPSYSQNIRDIQDAEQEQRLPVAQNPFDQYQNVAIPETPISFGGGMAEQLLNDNEVPEKIRKAYWFVFHKDNVLTFLDEERKRSKLMNMDIIKIDMLNSIPYYDYTFDLELQLNVIRNIFETKLDRALGGKSNVLNERKALQSQFSENKQISEMGQSPIREGFLKRLFNRR
jgi:hypothetical protein